MSTKLLLIFKFVFSRIRDEENLKYFKNKIDENVNDWQF